MPVWGGGGLSLARIFYWRNWRFFSTRCEDRSQSEECSKACRKGGTLKVLWRSASTVRSIFVGTSMTRPLRCGCTWLFRCACPVRAESSSRSLGHGVGSSLSWFERPCPASLPTRWRQATTSAIRPQWGAENAEAESCAQGSYLPAVLYMERPNLWRSSSRSSRGWASKWRRPRQRAGQGAPEDRRGCWSWC